MPDSTTFSSRFVTSAATMLCAATCQRRTALRLLMLTVGLVLVSGRSMVSRMLVVLGFGWHDWTAAYQIFSHPRVDITVLRTQIMAQWMALYEDDAPLVLVVDGTQLPRTGRKVPGVGFALHPRTPAWKPGIHRAQRWEGVSGLTPPTADGDCRTVPLWFVPAPTPSSRPWSEHPRMAEWQAALVGVQTVRDTLDAITPSPRSLVVVGDGAYCGAPVWTALPAETFLIARCAKNRALYAVPDPDAAPSRGRKRIYGERGPTPQAQGQERTGWQTCVIRVRGKDRHLRIRVTGPWVMKKAATQPLMLITVGGIGRKHGKMRRSRDMMHFLVNARQTPTGWVLPYAVEQLVSWVWQRWEVEVMHRELKSGWGLGDQQQWSPIAATVVTQWVVWAYAVLILTGVAGPPPAVRTARWYRSRRWTPRDLLLQLRQELWTAPPTQFQTVCPWFRANPSKNTALRVLLAVADAI